jgi:hypothetical protein
MIAQTNFTDSMQAKRFLVSRIAEEAHLQHEDLSELEEKMLYFSETYPTLPDMMKVAEKFETEVDSEAYEEKISRLAKGAHRRDSKESPENILRWKEAIKILMAEDHYLMVMMDTPISLPKTLRNPDWSFSEIVMLIGFAIMIACFVAAAKWAQPNISGTMRDKVVLLSFILVWGLYFLNSSRIMAIWARSVRKKGRGS